MRAQAVERAETERAAKDRELRELAEQHQAAIAENVHLGSANQQLSEELARSRDETGAARIDAHAAKVSLTEIRTRLEEAQKGFAEKEALFKQTGEQLKREFETLAGRIFDQQGERFRERSAEQLHSMLGPLREQMGDFRRRVDEVHSADARERASLLTEVRNLQRASERVNQEAENLTRALKGDKQVQGGWGELVLERVLEESGLRKGHEYYVQASLLDDEGTRRRPDVIIRLPDSKDVVVDSKVSLAAWERAVSADDEAEREIALKQHTASVRGHVRRLAERDYDSLPGVRSLDFVLLFVPVEAAFTHAMERDPSLFTEAFEKRLVIVSPTTLMMTLRIIENVWRYEKQNRNAQEIAQRAGQLYDKLRLILEDMDQLGRTLDTARRSFDSAYGRLATGRGNLVGHVEHFRELGANVRKPLPREVVDTAVGEEGSEGGD